MQQCKAAFGPSIHILTASSGNAGLAAAVSARKLGIKCTVYLPVIARQEIQQRMRDEGAHTVTVGQVYAESVVAMRAAAKNDPNACVPSPLMYSPAHALSSVIVPSYDHPVLWQGHASIVEEMTHQLQKKPDAILGSVGGGGLIGGVLLGCKIAGWDNGRSFGHSDDRV